MFGVSGGLRRPAPGRVHGPLLLALHRQDYAEQLHGQVLAEAAAHLEHSPWLAGLCSRAEATDSKGIAAGVAILHLLPQARQASEEGQQRLATREAEQVSQLSRLAQRVNESLAGLRGAADGLRLLFGEESRSRMADRLAEFLALSLEARGLVSAADQVDHQAWRALARAEPLVLGMRDRLDEWESASRINALWRHRQVGNAAGALLLVLFLFAPAWLPWVFAAPVIFAAWRLWILAHHRSAIRKLADGLPLRVPRPESP
jgi:hypothetical protein